MSSASSSVIIVVVVVVVVVLLLFLIVVLLLSSSHHPIPSHPISTEGVTFGISAGNPFSGEEHDEEYNRAANEELYADIRADVHESGIGAPDYIWPWQAYSERTRKKVFGFCVHFAVHPESPRAGKAERAMLLHARVYGQASIFKWFPHHYGPDQGPPVDGQPRHSIVIQRVLHTNGMTKYLKSSGPVWRTNADWVLENPVTVER